MLQASLNKAKWAGNKKIQWDMAIQVMNHCPKYSRKLCALFGIHGLMV